MNKNKTTESLTANKSLNEKLREAFNLPSNDHTLNS